MPTILVIAISIPIGYFVFGNITSKAGFPRWHGLLWVIPFLNLNAVVMFAFSEWPIESKLKELPVRSPQS